MMVMTEDQGLTPATSVAAPTRRLRRVWMWWSDFVNQTVKMKVVLGILAFVFVGFMGVVTQLRTLSENARSADQRAQNQAIYQTQVAAYTSAVSAYQLCVDGVSRSDANRAQWEALADIIDALPGGSEYAEQIREGPLLSQTPRTVEDCGAVPIPPKPPA